MAYYKRGLQGYLQNYLNEAVEKGIKDVKEIKKYAEQKYCFAHHTPLRFLDKMELYKSYFNE